MQLYFLEPALAATNNSNLQLQQVECSAEHVCLERTYVNRINATNAT